MNACIVPSCRIHVCNAPTVCVFYAIHLVQAFQSVMKFTFEMTVHLHRVTKLAVTHIHA